MLLLPLLLVLPLLLLLLLHWRCWCLFAGSPAVATKQKLACLAMKP